MRTFAASLKTINMLKVLFVSLMVLASANANASSPVVAKSNAIVPATAMTAPATGIDPVYVVDGIVKTKAEYDKLKSAGKIAQSFLSKKIDASQTSFLGQCAAEAQKYGAMFALSKGSNASPAYKKMMATYAKGKAAYTQGKAQYDQGKKAYDQGKSDYNSAKQDVNDAKAAGKEISSMFGKKKK